MNVALPPFDDIHVRRALNLVLDRTALARRLNDLGNFGPVTTTEHSLPDSVGSDLLASYDPYPLGGDAAAARREMARSRYDHDHNGRCDVSACKRVVAYGVSQENRALRVTDDLIRRDLAHIGVTLVVHNVSGKATFRALTQPRKRIPLSPRFGLARRLPRRRKFRPGTPKTERDRQPRLLTPRCDAPPAAFLGISKAIGTQPRHED